MSRAGRVGRWVGGLGALVGIVALSIAAGTIFVVQIPLTLAVGWARFIAQTLPEVEVNSGAVLMTLPVIALLAWGAHVSAGRAARAFEKAPPQWGTSLSALALVVLMFVASIASAGVAHQVGWLLRSDSPLLRNTWQTPDRQLRRRMTQVCGALGPLPLEPRSLQIALVSQSLAGGSWVGMRFTTLGEAQARTVLVTPADPAQEASVEGVVCQRFGDNGWVKTDSFDAQTLDEEVEIRGRVVPYVPGE